jgi:hypothetical protein
MVLIMIGITVSFNIFLVASDMNVAARSATDVGSINRADPVADTALG